jgi:DMSO/TMAO reductase YedYZ molybdopterin-dependent catalytic subunit
MVQTCFVVWAPPLGAPFFLEKFVNQGECSQMKRLFNKMLLLAGILLVLAIVAAAPSGCITKTVTVAPTTKAASLTVVNGSQTKTLSLADIKALPVVSGSTGDITSSGTIEGPYAYKGVALTDILKAVGGMTANNAVRISAKDGYSMTMSYNQIMKGAEFPTYDNTTGKEVNPSGTVTVFLVYEKDGNPIDDSIGPLRVGIMAPGQVTDGHWWIKWAQKIEVITMQQSWTISLQGAITQSMDKSTFESGAAPGCHGATWTDAQGHVYQGIALWYLVGNVDDANGDMSYSNAAADAGYEVHVVNSNGDMVSFTSQQVKRNENIILAFEIDGKPLPSTQWPLALVGSAVDAQHQIGMISKIKLVFPTTTTATTK